MREECCNATLASAAVSMSTAAIRGTCRQGHPCRLQSISRLWEPERAPRHGERRLLPLPVRVEPEPTPDHTCVVAERGSFRAQWSAPIGDRRPRALRTLRAPEPHDRRKPLPGAVLAARRIH